ncbi:MAG: PhoH family protein [Saprospiraceae bacterium]
MSEIILTIDTVDPVDLFGDKNRNLSLVQEAYPDTRITQRGNSVRISGEKRDTQAVKNRIEMMVRLLKEHHELPTQTVEDLLAGENPFATKLGRGNGNKTIVHSRTGRPIKAKTKNQQVLVDTAGQNDIVFAVGPAGTGKTYTAVALAVRALKNKEVKKIILTRPAVEAGENLGFLPGDLKDKIDPYLRPLYDALDDMIAADKLKQFTETRVLEIAPLAYMRGRTLDNAFVILDEAQNATTSQLKMFLTRLGPSAKCIITGDLSQVDLPRSQTSGLRYAVDILGRIKGIGVVRLSADDVVRHRLVKEIIKAYDAENERWQGDRRFDDRPPDHGIPGRSRAEQNGSPGSEEE